MNIKGKNAESTNSFVKRVNYNGIFQLQLVAVNPDLSTMNSMGFPFKKEPVYIENGTGVVYVDLYFKLDDPIVKEDTYIQYRLRLENNERPVGRTSGKAEYINNRGKTTWFLPDSVPTDEDWRRTRIGEGNLYNFLFAFFAMTPMNEEHSIEFKDKDAIFTGNVTEIRELVTKYPDNRVKDMVGVKNGYMRLSGNFANEFYTPQDGDWFIKSVLGLDKDGNETPYGFKAEFNTFEPSVYVPKIHITANLNSNESSDSSDSDDLPF